MELGGETKMNATDIVQFYELEKSEFVERFPEFSLFYRLFSPLDSEMICIFPYFYPCEEGVSQSLCKPPN